MDEKQFEALMRRMDSLTKLLAFNIIKDRSVNDQVDVLTKAGLKASDIAELLGKEPNQIYVTQTLLRKAKKKEPPKEPPSTQESTQTETASSV